MTPIKLIAFLLCLTSLTGLLYLGAVAGAGPLLMSQYVPAPPPLDQLNRGCLALFMFGCSAPFAAAPGLVGLGLWLFTIRKQEAAVDREALSLPKREAAFQACLDGLTQRLAECGGNPAAVAAEISVQIRELDGLQPGRLLRFLATCGAGSYEEGTLSVLSENKPKSGSRGWGTRVLVLGLFAFAVFCLFWGALIVFTYLSSNVGQAIGIQSGPREAAFGSIGCFIPGLCAMTGGLVLGWLTRKEKARQQRHEACRLQAQDIALESCLRRIEKLLPVGEETSPLANTVAGRLARAQVACILSELDGEAKGRLITRLRSGGFLPRLNLEGIDLRNATLAKADLSSLVLADADLSGAVLGGAILIEANLRGSHLRGADLREADASGADLRQADLRHALMHRCRLCQADLRGANLEGANLWQADLTGAQLDGASEKTRETKS